MVASKKLVDYLMANYEEDISIGMAPITDITEENAYLFIDDDYVVIIHNEGNGIAISLTITSDYCFVNKCDANNGTEDKYEYTELADSIKMYNKLADQHLPY